MFHHFARRTPDPTVDRVLADLRAHPIAEAAAKHAFEERQRQRRELADKAERLREDGEADLASLRRELDAAAADLVRAREAVSAAVRREANARGAIQSRGIAMETGITRCANLIREMAEPALDDARRRVADMLAQRPKAEEFLRTIGRDDVTGRRLIAGSSNVASLERRRQALLDVSQALDGMVVEPDQSGLDDRIAELLASIPAIESEAVEFASAVPPRELTRERVGATIIGLPGGVA